MDLMDFDQATLYFDDPVDEDVSKLVAEAGAAYGQEAAELLLLKAFFQAPESLLVLVALYRYYFYQHRLDDALRVAGRAMTIVGRRLHFPGEWKHLSPSFLGQGVMQSMGLLRFYLNVLKAAGYINLRLGRLEGGRAMLEKLVELDSHDRLGGKVLLAVLDAENEAAA
jgi:tetratricopeptide (TPR) repeat protein